MSVPDFVAIHPTVVKIFLAWSKKVDHFNVSTTNNSKPFQSVSVWLNWLCWLTSPTKHGHSDETFFCCSLLTGVAGAYTYKQQIRGRVYPVYTQDGNQVHCTFAQLNNVWDSWNIITSKHSSVNLTQRVFAHISSLEATCFFMHVAPGREAVQTALKYNLSACRSVKLHITWCNKRNRKSRESRKHTERDCNGTSESWEGRQHSNEVCHPALELSSNAMEKSETSITPIA